MINPDILRNNPQLVKDSQLARGESIEIVENFEKVDKSWRLLNIETDTLRSKLKDISKEIGEIKIQQKKDGNTVNQDLLDSKTKLATDLSNEIKLKSEKLDQLKQEADEYILQLSNLLDPEAPIGTETDFKIIETIGEQRNFNAEGFKPKDHLELAKNLIDMERGAKVSGSRFYFLKSEMALLELALVNFAMDIAQEFGFCPVIPPSLVKPEAMGGTGFLGQAAENVYRIEQDDLYLVGTSEVPLAAMHMNEIIESNDLPLKYAGFSPCFRREAGSHGKDTKGIFRVHWFDKVEMFVYCEPEEAKKIHQQLIEIEKTVLKRLEIPFRVIDVASQDLGSSAARKFDCEAWIPSVNQYRELTSTSNCTDFQSRRLMIRSRKNNQTNYLSTLNGTLIAVTRTMIALLENHQQKDGSVKVPSALKSYLKNKDFILSK